MGDSEGSSNANLSMFVICILLHTSDGKTGKLGKCSVFDLMDDLTYLICSSSKLTEKFGTTHTFVLWKNNDHPNPSRVMITLTQRNAVRPVYHHEGKECFNFPFYTGINSLIQKTFLRYK